MLRYSCVLIFKKIFSIVVWNGILSKFIVQHIQVDPSAYIFVSSVFWMMRVYNVYLYRQSSDRVREISARLTQTHTHTQNNQHNNPSSNNQIIPNEFVKPLGNKMFGSWLCHRRFKVTQELNWKWCLILSNFKLGLSPLIAFVRYVKTNEKWNKKNEPHGHFSVFFFIFF